MRVSRWDLIAPGYWTTPQAAAIEAARTVRRARGRSARARSKLIRPPRGES
ncbi:MAG: hypothetical protein WD749_05525 [Phycisphaerales bacterium]